jgi:hypothetical protein
VISFLTLLLGLVTGSGEVALTVSGPVAAAVVELDGRPVGRIEGPPWKLTVDFGSALVPHELVARGLDAEGQEVVRARQLINVPRPAAEVRILFERDGKGNVVSARLSGQSLLGSRTRRAEATFDGKALTIDESSRVTLPPYDHRKAHVLTAELEFSSPGGMHTLRSRADAVVGGISEGEAEGALTAVPIRLPPGAPAPSRNQLQGLVVKAGEPLNVVAVDHGPAEVWIVRDMGSEEAARKLAGGPYKETSFFSWSTNSSRLGDGDRLQFVWPMAKRFGGADVSSDLLDLSQVQKGGLYRILTGVSHPERSTPTQRFSDAVAVAGLQAIQNGTRRAVLLILGAEVSDGGSRFSPEQVRRYLQEIRVPLFVWTLGNVASGIPADGWGETTNVSSPPSFTDAVRKLRDDLGSQSIVWVSGRHLPRDIALTAQAGDVRIVE